MAGTVIVFCAHSDDQVLGPGGAVAALAQGGYEVVSVVFSNGELTHPWVKRRVTAEIREAEAVEADKVLGGREVLFLRINDSGLAQESQAQWVMDKLQGLIAHYRPVKIFTHSADDWHPAHRAVFHAAVQALDKAGLKCDLYSFDIWNPFNIKGRNEPKLYVDVTGTFSLKLKALKCFRSQWVSMVSLLWSVYLRAFLNGLDFGCRYAERFYKVR
ncbi:PIG-L family deacetylase [Candidatus Woesearchaeota archaeon]|nr:PIG-L family deacetylase [Candidatus Woesearchaeota archaeon]